MNHCVEIQPQLCYGFLNDIIRVTIFFIKTESMMCILFYRINHKHLLENLKDADASMIMGNTEDPVEYIMLKFKSLGL